MSSNQFPGYRQLTLFGALIAAMLIAAAQAPAACAQEAPASPASPAPQANWASNCSAASRRAPLSCSLEQRVVLRATGQQVARVAVQTSGPEPPRALPLQTCGSGGCYSASTVDTALLSAL